MPPQDEAAAAARDLAAAVVASAAAATDGGGGTAGAAAASASEPATSGASLEVVVVPAEPPLPVNPWLAQMKKGTTVGKRMSVGQTEATVESQARAEGVEGVEGVDTRPSVAAGSRAVAGAAGGFASGGVAVASATELGLLWGGGREDGERNALLTLALTLTLTLALTLPTDPDPDPNQASATHCSSCSPTTPRIAPCTRCSLTRAPRAWRCLPHPVTICIQPATLCIQVQRASCMALRQAYRQDTLDAARLTLPLP